MLFAWLERNRNTACTYSLQQDWHHDGPGNIKKRTYLCKYFKRDKDPLLQVAIDLRFDQPEAVNHHGYSMIRVIDPNTTEIMRIISLSLITRFTVERPSRRTAELDYSSPPAFFATATQAKECTGHMGSIMPKCLSIVKGSKLKDKDERIEALIKAGMYKSWASMAHGLLNKEHTIHFNRYFFH